MKSRKAQEFEEKIDNLEKILLDKWDAADDTIKDDLGMTELDYIRADLYWLHWEPETYIEAIESM